MACADVHPITNDAYIEDPRAGRGWLIVSPTKHLESALARLIAGSKDAQVPKIETRLHADIVDAIIAFTDASTLSVMSAVCKEWRERATREKYWERLVKADFGVQISELRPVPASARGFYGVAYRARREQLHGGSHGLTAALNAALKTPLSAGAIMGVLMAGNRHVMNAAQALGWRFR